VPEVGGPIDPDSEAHDLIMSVFGGMSKGERNRIKIRVRAAMASQTKIEGRYLGGRPPYGYRIADAGPHPNPAKAADGKRLHRLEPDPITAPVVQRIYREYLTGRGLYAIAEGLLRDGIPSPSQHDAARNRHRTGEGWAKAAIKTILSNPRYTGRQVWNKQRKDEVLLDVDEVSLGYETKMRWNDPDQWIWSDAEAHPALITTDQFEAVQRLRSDRGTTRVTKEVQQRVRHPHVLRGLFYCDLCGRRMQAQRSHSNTYYRCRYPREYALANSVQHPFNIYVRENDVLPALDDWLASVFAPHRLDHTIRALAKAQQDDAPAKATADDTELAAVIAGCDAKLDRYQAALDAGADPAAVAEWTRAVRKQRDAAVAAATVAKGAPTQLIESEIAAIIDRLGDLAQVIKDADPADKAAIYASLGLKLTYQPGKRIVRAEVDLDPHDRGAMVCVRGGT
jgi:DNA invertase Pin-like site-specific DNA recombinase